MRLPCDDRKDARNIAKHRISLQEALYFDFRTAIVTEDKRFDYPERRWRAIGRIGSAIFFLAFAMTDKPFRPISLRLATPQEVERWNAKQAGLAKVTTRPTKTPR